MNKIDTLLNLPLNVNGEPYTNDIERVIGKVDFKLLEVIRGLIKRVNG